ncbi:MAG: hypothetical protein HQL36_03080 [Alphaproteobacteria bacterium]|nr:hypothetical protein [Alphaproteobacteria bacterium]
MTDKKALTTAEAAAYVNAASPAQFLREVRQGVWPGPLTKNSRPQRWSRAALDACLDGGIMQQNQQEHALDKELGL